eukprot:scaffold307984_cov39-Prasinocladus_malaysianus.AAC.1
MLAFALQLYSYSEARPCRGGLVGPPRPDVRSARIIILGVDWAGLKRCTEAAANSTWNLHRVSWALPYSLNSGHEHVSDYQLLRGGRGYAFEVCIYRAVIA